VGPISQRRLTGQFFLGFYPGSDRETRTGCISGTGTCFHPSSGSGCTGGCSGEGKALPRREAAAVGKIRGGDPRPG